MKKVIFFILFFVFVGLFSSQPFVQSAPTHNCLARSADFIPNGIIDIYDFNFFVTKFASNTGVVDLNGDCKTDIFDFNLLIGVFNTRIIPTASPVITDPAILTNPLVVESRRLIIKHGFSEKYFDDHFVLTDFDGSRTGHIIWRYRLGDYQTALYDGLGYNNHGPLHSIAPALLLKLPSVRNLELVVSRKQADAALHSCPLDFARYEVVLNLSGPNTPIFGAPVSSQLVLVGQTIFFCPPFGDGPCVAKSGVVDLETGKLIYCTTDNTYPQPTPIATSTPWPTAFLSCEPYDGLPCRTVYSDNWYFDKTKNQCIHPGALCSGSQFTTKEACEQSCLSVQPTIVINTSCNTDADCAIKQTPYCCGNGTFTYYSCRNENSNVPTLSCNNGPYSCPRVVTNVVACQCVNNNCVNLRAPGHSFTCSRIPGEYECCVPGQFPLAGYAPGTIASATGTQGNALCRSGTGECYACR